MKARIFASAAITLGSFGLLFAFHTGCYSMGDCDDVEPIPVTSGSYRAETPEPEQSWGDFVYDGARNMNVEVQRDEDRVTISYKDRNGREIVETWSVESIQDDDRGVTDAPDAPSRREWDGDEYDYGDAGDAGDGDAGDVFRGDAATSDSSG